MSVLLRKLFSLWLKYTMLMDLERGQILSYTRMNEESSQVMNLLRTTVLSNFVVNSTTVAYTYLNSSLHVFCFKKNKTKKRFTNFPFKNQTPNRVLHFKCLIVVSDQVFAVNNKDPRRFNCNIIPVNLKFIGLQVYDRYSYISLDPQVL